MFEHDMSKGFPILTTKRVSLKQVAIELEFFIKGLSDKRWLQDRGCHIWDDWANPATAPYGHDAGSKELMRITSDLGRIYGVQWRDWGGYIDQLKTVIDTLKTDPTNRRLLVQAWNPAELDQMALPPCHYGFQLISDGKTVDLLWNQRSVDVPLGLPYNIASYALLLELICLEVGMKPGKLIGFLADVHIYENQLDGIAEQLTRPPKPLPTLLVPNFNSIWSWTYEQRNLLGYHPHPAISFPIAV